MTQRCALRICHTYSTRLKHHIQYHNTNPQCLRYFNQMLYSTFLMIVDFTIQPIEVTPTEYWTQQTFPSVFRQLLAQSTSDVGCGCALLPNGSQVNESIKKREHPKISMSKQFTPSHWEIMNPTKTELCWRQRSAEMSVA